MQKYAEEAAVHRQRASAVVVDKAKLLELIHEMAHARTRRADHLGQILLIYAGKDRFGSTVLAKMSQEQENPGQRYITRFNR